MNRVVWTEEAERDVAEMLEWLSGKNPQAARRARSAIARAVHALARRPLLGRQSSQPGSRVWSLPDWRRRIVYRLEEGTIQILTVKHTRQNLSP